MSEKFVRRASGGHQQQQAETERKKQGKIIISPKIFFPYLFNVGLVWSGGLVGGNGSRSRSRLSLSAGFRSPPKKAANHFLDIFV
jgi:hypothetical protein